MAKLEQCANLRKYFWDVDFDALDIDIDKKYILERILDFGDEESVQWAKQAFSKRDILAVLENSRKISEKSLNFWNLVLSNSHGNSS